MRSFWLAGDFRWKNIKVGWQWKKKSYILCREDTEPMGQMRLQSFSWQQVWSWSWSHQHSRGRIPAWSAFWSAGQSSSTAIIGWFQKMWQNVMPRIRRSLPAPAGSADSSGSRFPCCGREKYTTSTDARSVSRRSGFRGEKERLRSNARSAVRHLLRTAEICHIHIYMNLQKIRKIWKYFKIGVYKYQGIWYTIIRRAEVAEWQTR